MPMILRSKKVCFAVAVLGLSAMIAACHQTSKSPASTKSNSVCGLQFCTQKFSALVFGETWLIQIRVADSDRFYGVDPNTDSDVIKQFVFVPSQDRDYTGYSGVLDGEIIEHARERAHWIRISRLIAFHRVSDREADSLAVYFEGPPRHYSQPH